MKKQYFIILIILPSLLFLGCSHESLKIKSDGGIFKSVDSGSRFEPKQKIDEQTNISNVNINDIAVSNSDSNIVYIGTVGNGMLKSEDGGETWKSLFTGSTVWQISLNPLNNDTIYIAVTVNKRGKIFKSLDAGNNWEEIYTEARFDFDILALGVDNRDPSNIYAGDVQGVVFKSVDSGRHWRVIDHQKTPISLIKISPINPQKIYYLSGGGLWASGDGGETFTNLKLPQAGSSSGITSVEVDPQDENIIYVSAQRSILKSTDSGQNFFSINILNPKGPKLSNVAVNPKNNQEWYYGAGFAVYKTSNNGNSWSVSEIGSNRNIKIIKINPEDNSIIYLGMEKIKKQRSF